MMIIIFYKNIFVEYYMFQGNIFVEYYNHHCHSWEGVLFMCGVEFIHQIFTPVSLPADCWNTYSKRRYVITQHTRMYTHYTYMRTVSVNNEHNTYTMNISLRFFTHKHRHALYTYAQHTSTDKGAFTNFTQSHTAWICCCFWRGRGGTHTLTLER